MLWRIRRAEAMLVGMADRRTPNPKVMLVIVAAVGFLLSMLAIVLSVGHGPGSTPGAPVTETTTTSPSRPPPLILPPPMMPVPCAATSEPDCAEDPAGAPAGTPAPSAQP